MARRSHSRRQRHDSATLELPPARPLRLAIVADTHSRPHPDAHDLIAREKPDGILHGGDVGALEVLDGLRSIAPVIAVRGNIDPTAVLPDSVSIDVVSEGRSHLRMLLLHIALTGPKLRADAARLAARHDASLVVCGHSHVPFIGEDRGFTIFNPGSIGPRRFTLPILFGVATIGSSGTRLEHVSCETGERWMP